MSNISSNSLFHITGRRENLIGILRNNFLPRFSEELVPFSSNIANDRFSGAIPMVCFCDISLGQIRDHLNMYGHYGIGMTKEWGTRMGLNPVVYLNPDTLLSEIIGNLGQSTYMLLEEHCTETTKNLSDNFMRILSYLKPYKGPFKREGILYENVRFYNEREWRYVPDIGFDVYKNIDENDLPTSNIILEEYPLEFVPNDIKYIFVPNDDEIHSMVKEIKQIKGKSFSPREIDILASKILTTHQILEDF